MTWNCLLHTGFGILVPIVLPAVAHEDGTLIG